MFDQMLLLLLLLSLFKKLFLLLLVNFMEAMTSLINIDEHQIKLKENYKNYLTKLEKELEYYSYYFNRVDN